MSENVIKLTVGRATELPDAHAVARKLAAVVNLVESIDRRSWAVKNARYSWVIASASVGSPAQIVVQPKKLLDDTPDGSAVESLVAGIESIQTGAVNKLGPMFAPEDTRWLKELAGLSKPERAIPFRLSILDESGKEDSSVVVRAEDLFSSVSRMSAKAIPDPEYVSIEGWLTEIRDWEETHRFQLVDRWSRQEINCLFRPEDRGELVKHLRSRIHVEGYLQEAAPGKRAVLTVESFSPIPTSSITLDEVHERNLRVPGGMSTEDFVRSLRSPAGE